MVLCEKMKYTNCSEGDAHIEHIICDGGSADEKSSWTTGNGKITSWEKTKNYPIDILYLLAIISVSSLVGSCVVMETFTFRFGFKKSKKAHSVTALFNLGEL